MAMSVQQPAKSCAIPSALLSPVGTAVGLRRPIDRFALRPSFASSPITLSGVGVATAPRFSMRVASKQSYICRDCGYIYSDKKPFDKLPDNYFCPGKSPSPAHLSSYNLQAVHAVSIDSRICAVCGAPKRRFRAYEPTVSKNANDLDVRKARKEQIKRDEAVGQALPIAIIVGIALLGGVYLYVNNNF